MQLTAGAGCSAIELSALRSRELAPLIESLDSIDLAPFSYISIHAPSNFGLLEEAGAADLLRRELWRQWPIIVHPDALSDFSLWREFGPLLCIENMDKRKPIGRTADELARIFERLPDASLCFDIGHARQVDPTMLEARLILREFAAKVRQLHVSEVNSQSKHDPLSWASILAFHRVAHLVQDGTPLILETPAEERTMQGEIEKARLALSEEVERWEKGRWIPLCSPA